MLGIRSAQRMTKQRHVPDRSQQQDFRHLPAVHMQAAGGQRRKQQEALLLQRAPEQIGCASPLAQLPDEVVGQRDRACAFVMIGKQRPAGSFERGVGYAAIFRTAAPDRESEAGSDGPHQFGIMFDGKVGPHRSILPSRHQPAPLGQRQSGSRFKRRRVRISGGRATSFSLPGSRRGSIREDSPFHFGAATPQASTSSHRRAHSIPDAVLLDSLNVAHKQLASAGNLALTLTRQLSAPLRPVFHMTLFLSISSITVLSLACFLCASYMLTAWDDVSKRTHKVGEVAGRTRHRFERTLDWGLRMLGPNDAPSRGNSKPSKAKASDASGATASGSQPARGATPSSGATSSSKDSESRSAVSTAGHAFLWPARMAWSGASVVAYRITPPVITQMFEQDKGKGKAKAKSTGSTLPPRPPLSTLLPSILFTLLLAIGAGLTSFLASRRAAAEAGVADSHSASPSAQPYTVPSSSSSPGMDYVHLASSPSASPFVGSHGAKSFHSMRAANHLNAQTWDKDVSGKRRAPGGFDPTLSTAFVR